MERRFAISVVGGWYTWADPYADNAHTEYLEDAAFFNSENSAKKFVKAFYFGDLYAKVVEVLG